MEDTNVSVEEKQGEKPRRKRMAIKKTDPVKTRVEEIRKLREKKRISLKRRDVLAYPKRPGFVRRVVNNVPGRIQQFEDRGWSVVTGDETGGPLSAADPTKPGSAVTRVVGTGKDGPITGVLMEIPEEIYAEDQWAKQEGIDATEDALEQDLKRKGVRWKNTKVETKFG